MMLTINAVVLKTYRPAGILLLGLALFLLLMGGQPRPLEAAATTTTVAWGPFTIAANSSFDGLFPPLSEPGLVPPCTDCYITEIVPDLVYASSESEALDPDATSANLINGGMLHHTQLNNESLEDITCPSMQRRFFASGNERIG